MSENKINIDAKGYEKIYKAVTRDRGLPIISKAILGTVRKNGAGNTVVQPAQFLCF